MAKTGKGSSVAKKKSPKKPSSASSGLPSEGPSLTGLKIDDTPQMTLKPKRKKGSTQSSISSMTKKTESTELSDKKSKSKKTSTRKASKLEATDASSSQTVKKKHPPKKHTPINATPQKSPSISLVSTSVSAKETQRVPSFQPTVGRRTKSSAGILRKNSSHHTQHQQRHDTSSHRARFVDATDRFGSTDELDSVSDESGEEMPRRFDNEPREGPKKQRSYGFRPAVPPPPGRKKSMKNFLDISSHSAGSNLSTDDENIFQNDPWWKIFLRYFRILAPYPNERQERKRIRQFIWSALVLDFIAAMVSITTYNGVTTCCGVPIFSLSLVDINWGRTIRITTYLYLVMIVAEVIPVVRKGIPFNLLNPMLGFAITFAMFFDDRITEAVAMWIIEAGAIFFEFLVYRTQSKLYHEKFNRLQELGNELAHFFKSKKNVPKSSSHHSKHGIAQSSNRNRLDRLKSIDTSSHSNDSNDSNNDDDDDKLSTNSGMSGNSFGEEDDLEASKNLESSRGFVIRNNPKLHKMRLLRERRILRQQQARERTQLRYHFVGVVVNGALVCISLILIITIATSGGLCVRDYERPVVFGRNQLDKCSGCRGNIFDGKCELCEDGQMQCYYQYI